MSLQGFRAPAAHDTAPSSSTDHCHIRTWSGDDENHTHYNISKNSQATTTIKVLSHFVWSFSIRLIIRLYQLEKTAASSCGSNPCIPSFWKMTKHTCCTTTHYTSKCWSVSSAWLERGQDAGCCNPCLANLSIVQQQLSTASHTKDLHPAGPSQPVHSSAIGLLCTSQLTKTSKLIGKYRQLTKTSTVSVS